jgi:hypothetical protein
MKIILGDLDAKVGNEDIFRPTKWNESLHEMRLMGNMKMELGETVWGGMDQIHCAQDRDKWKAEYGNEPWGFIKCWEVGLSSMELLSQAFPVNRVLCNVLFVPQRISYYWKC